MQQTPKTRELTVLFYANGNVKNHHVTLALQAGLQAAREIGNTEDVAFVSQIGFGYKDGETTRELFEPGEYDYSGNLLDQIADNLGPQNMGDEKTALDFLRWGVSRYPAKRYMVVFGGHGGAFRGALPDQLSEDTLELNEFKNALGTVSQEMGQKFSVAVFDCCFMSCAEAAHSVKDSVERMVASEYVAFTSNFSPGDFARKVIAESAGGALTADGIAQHALGSMKKVTAEAIVDCTAMDEFGNKLQSLSAHLLNSDADTEAIRDCFRRSRDVSYKMGENDNPVYWQIRDLGSLCDELGHLADSKVQESARELKSFVQTDVVKARKVGEKHAHATGDSIGLSIYGPAQNAQAWKSTYDKLSLAEATDWDLVVQSFGAAEAYRPESF